MKENVCYIFGAGEYNGQFPLKRRDGFIIAADGGYSYLRLMGIEPDLIVGDFDSLISPPTANHVVTLECIKDDTDTMAAVKIGLERGFTRFHIYGGTGGRIDHTIANIQCLSYLAEKGCRGFLYDREIVLTAIFNDSISFPAIDEGFISVFSSHGKAQGVSISGLKYPLTNVNLCSANPIGVSNEFIGKKSKITVKDGILLITYPSHLSV